MLRRVLILLSAVLLCLALVGCQMALPRKVDLPAPQLPLLRLPDGSMPPEPTREDAEGLDASATDDAVSATESDDASRQPESNAAQQTDAETNNITVPDPTAAPTEAATSAPNESAGSSQTQTPTQNPVPTQEPTPTQNPTPTATSAPATAGDAAPVSGDDTPSDLFP